MPDFFMRYRVRLPSCIVSASCRSGVDPMKGEHEKTRRKRDPTQSWPFSVGSASCEVKPLAAAHSGIRQNGTSLVRRCLGEWILRLAQASSCSARHPDLPGVYVRSGVYGNPRIHTELRTQGYTCSRKRIARLMREQEISAKPKRRRVLITHS
jgi:hypothetical protein